MLFQETESIELKRVLNDSIEKEIVSFLNTHNGTIYIGVDDDGTVLGVNNVDKLMRDIADIITTKILPNPQEFIETKAIYEQGKLIIVIDIKKGNHLYYIKKYGRSATGCYVRIGTSCRSMTEEQIEKEYINSINSLNNYSIVEEESYSQRLTFKTFKIYLDEKNISYNADNFEENNKLLTKTGKYNYLAYILSDQFDLSIKIARFNGNDKKGDFLYRKEFGYKSLIKIIEDVPNYIETNLNKVRSYFDRGVQRRDEFLLDKNSVREAWINACCHNDYSTHLGPAVFVYNDHIEFFSYGNPLKKQSKDKFLSGISNPVNPELAMILMKLGIIEQSGKGVNTIVKYYGDNVFKFSDEYLQVELPYNKAALDNFTEHSGEESIAESTLTDSQNSSVNLTETQRSIIELIKENNEITVGELAKYTNKTESTIYKAIKILKEKGVIIREGSDKNGKYIFK